MSEADLHGASREVLRVLVIDDSETIRELLAVLLREAGHEVLLAESGEAGLAAAQRHCPDAILLDMEMPGMHGLDVLDRLSSAPELTRIPVIVVTGADGHAEVIDAFDRGAHDYVTKPFESPILLARVAAAARAKQRADDLHAAAERFRGEARQDALTGLANRRMGEAELRKRITASARDHQPLSLLKIDVDHFKQINDRFGHEVGDRALQVVARCLRRYTRDADLLVRWGGDEFVLLAGADAEGAERAAQNLRSGLEGCHREIQGGWSDPLTVSIGVAEWRGGPAEVLLKRADRALYDAKDAGRDTVRVASGEDFAAA